MVCSMVLLAAALSTLTWAPPARAQGFDLTVIPAKMELEVPAGETARFSIELRNSGADPLRLRIYAMDFSVTPDNTFIFEEPGHYPYSCAPWIEVEGEDALELPAGASASPSFLMRVPQDAEPGGHFAVLFFQDASTPQPGQGAELTPRIGCQVLLTVPGEIVREGRIEGFEVESDYWSLWGPPAEGQARWPARNIRYRLAVENTGNVHITVFAAIRYRASFGRGAGEVELGSMTVLPGTVRYFEGSLPSPPCLGRFRAEAVIMYGPDQFTFEVEERAEAGFTVIPLLWLLFVALLAVAAWLGLRALRRRAKGKGGPRRRLRVSIKLEKEGEEGEGREPSGPAR
ncbi:MAG: hypothetical protein HPY75_11500 [Actinobacteria bacterium]|nr:hypothetical protein [Actinomycetota bacterium]